MNPEYLSKTELIARHRKMVDALSKSVTLIEVIFQKFGPPPEDCEEVREVFVEIVSVLRDEMDDWSPENN
jgi:hypothetical protein